MLSNEVVERLGELLAKATVPPKWKVCGFAPNPYWIDALTIPTTPQNADLIVAAVNALPELLRVYRLWLDGEWAGCSDCNEMGEWKNKRCEECGGSGFFRLVRDGDSGEG